jgi:hypothetical protein
VEDALGTVKELEPERQVAKPRILIDVFSVDASTAGPWSYVLQPTPMPQSRLDC